MAITRTQQAKQLLNEIAPKGERLAYINSREAELLKKMGGAGIDVNGTGIKSYVNFGGGGSGYGSAQDTFDSAAGKGGSRTGAGGGPGASRSDTGGSYDDAYQQSVNTNTAIAKSRNPTITDSNDSVFNTIKQNVYNSPFKTKGIGRTLGYLLGNIFMPGIGGLLGGYLGGKKATSMANKFNLNKENLAEVPNIKPFYDFDDTTNPVKKDIGIINKDISNLTTFKLDSALDKQIKKLDTLEKMGYPQPNIKNLKEMDMKQFKEKGIPLSLDRSKYVAANGGLATMFRQKR